MTPTWRFLFVALASLLAVAPARSQMTGRLGPPEPKKRIEIEGQGWRLVYGTGSNLPAPIKLDTGEGKIGRASCRERV